MTSKFIKKDRAAIDYIGCSPRTLHRMIKDKRIPAPVRLSAKNVGWFEHQLHDWLRQKEAEATR